MPIKLLVLGGGGVFGLFLGGGECRFCFYGRKDLSDSWDFPNLVFQTWLFAIFTGKRSFALFSTLLRSFADLRSRSFALICALLCVSASESCLERPRSGISDFQGIY